MLVHAIFYASLAVIASAEKETPCIDGMRTKTLNFDDIYVDPAIGGSIKGKYHGVVVGELFLQSFAKKVNFTGYSKKNFALAATDPSPHSITVDPLNDNFGDNGDIKLESFDATCATFGSHGSSQDTFLPQNCTILVTSTYVQGLRRSDTAYLYEYNIADFKAPRFKHFAVGQKQKGYTLNWSVVGPPLGREFTYGSGTYLYVDNIVLTAKCKMHKD